MFVAEGFVAASMDRVAEIAGVSKRTIYNHFVSKDELFREIVGTMVDEILEPIDRAVVRAATVDAALLEFATRYADVILSDRRIKLHRLVMGELARFPSLGTYYTNGYSRATQGVAHMLERFARRGLLAIVDYDEAATCFWQLTISESHNQLLFAPAMTKEELNLEDRLVLGIRHFLKIYKAPS